MFPHIVLVEAHVGKAVPEKIARFAVAVVCIKHWTLLIEI